MSDTGRFWYNTGNTSIADTVLKNTGYTSIADTGRIVTK